MKKIIKTTHIDTGSHGYLSVSKKDFILTGCDPSKVTGCSGHTLTRIYLEEDCDQSYFWDTATANGFTIERKSGYNLKFSIKHNYNPELFHFMPEVGDNVIFHNGANAQIILVPGIENATTKEGIMVLVLDGNYKGSQYKIPLSNPFSYIKSGKKLKTILEEINKDIKIAANS